LRDEFLVVGRHFFHKWVLLNHVQLDTATRRL
jgi:hypothetical protein